MFLLSTAKQFMVHKACEYRARCLPFYLLRVLPRDVWMAACLLRNTEVVLGNTLKKVLVLRVVKINIYIY
jgi:hypothetical protein